MKVNGTILCKLKPDYSVFTGVFDDSFRVNEIRSKFAENGDPVGIPENWITPIECLIKTVMHNRKGKYEGEKFTASSYEVLIESPQLERVISEVTDAKLINDRGVVLGVFPIQNVQFLDTVQRVKITV